MNGSDVLDAEDIVLAAFHLFATHPEIAHLEQLNAVGSKADSEFGGVAARLKILVAKADPGCRVEPGG